MKQFLSVLFIAVLFGITSLIAQPTGPKVLRVSPYATVLQTVGATDISISYHRPGVKGREIWGKLVPYNQVWRAGANNATVFDFSQDVTIAGTKLKAGKYSFFLIPSENEWTVIFNSVADQWGAYSYDSTKNVLSFKVKPEAGMNTEWLLYTFTDVSVSSAKVVMQWEKVAVGFTINTETEEVLKKLSAQMRSAARDQSASFARYAFDSNTQWEKGMQSIESALAIEKTFSLLSLKASLYSQKEMWAEAVQTGEEAIKVGKESNANTTNFEKTVSGWKEKLPAAKGKKK